MGRHRTVEEKRELGERARAMRAEGRSRREVMAELHVGEDLVRVLLQGTEVPESLRRPRAKDGVREAAVAMHRDGHSYSQIAAALGVTKGSLSLWLRAVAPIAVDPSGLPPAQAEARRLRSARRDEARRLREEGLLLADIAERIGVSVKTAYDYTWDLAVPAHARHGRDPEALHADLQAYWQRERPRRQALREDQERAHADAVGPLTREQLHLAAVTAYWCEGSKSKSYARREQVTFINSDVGLVRLWLAFLDDIGFPDEHRRFRVSIHETADVLHAMRSWADDLGLDVERFQRPTLKRHNPRTVRLNTGDEYRGCLIVHLNQSAELYRRIAGTWAGMMRGLPQTTAAVQPSGEAQSRVV